MSSEGNSFTIDDTINLSTDVVYQVVMDADASFHSNGLDHGAATAFVDPTISIVPDADERLIFSSGVTVLSVAAVPEPPLIALLLVGFAAVHTRRKRGNPSTGAFPSQWRMTSMFEFFRNVRTIPSIVTGTRLRFVRLPLLSPVIAIALVAAAPTRAATIPTVQVTDPFLQLYNVGVNSDGFRTGQEIRFGATSVTPNGLNGTTGTATTTNTATKAAASASIGFNPGPAIPNFFSTNITYSANLLAPYTLKFQSPGYTTYQTTIALPAGLTEVPFVNSITLTGTAQNPKFSWTPPAGTTVNGYRVNIYDKALINFDTTKGPINNGEVVTSSLQPSVTSYTVSAADFTVPGYALTNGHRYSIEISILQTRDGLSTNLGNANVDAISRVYADFTPVDNGNAPAVNLPVVLSNGSYQFNIAVQAGQTYYIDPLVATGYTYQIGVGDPNFASVLLPALQGAFDVSFLRNGLLETDSVLSGIAFDFPNGGVGSFTVTGIDPTDGLDPNDTTAFVTGLTFVSAGLFTGTQTPITASATVAEPSTIALVFGAAAGLLAVRRRRASSKRREPDSTRWMLAPVASGLVPNVGC